MSLMAARSVECMTMNPRQDHFKSKGLIIRLKLPKGLQLSQVSNTTANPKQSNLKNNASSKPQRLDCCDPKEERELVQLVAMAKRAADLVAIKRLSTTDPQFSCALNALNTLKSFPVTPDSLRSTQVIKCLEFLTKHPKVKIRTEAAIVLQSWKKKLSAPPEPSGISLTEKHEMGHNRMTAPTLPKAFDIPETIIGSTKSGFRPKLCKKAEEAPELKQGSSCNLREKIRGNLLEALSKVVAETTDESLKAKAEACNSVEIAASIESSMYKKMGQSSGKNMAKYRSILFNLRDPNNPELRRRVLLGEIRPESLVEMTAEEMASRKRKRENEEIRLKRLFGCEAIRNEEEEATTEQFKCGKCGQRKCTYYQMQTRSADEPMTTFVRCVVCSNRWKFC